MVTRPDVIDWLLTSGEPWTRYRTLIDLLDRPADDAESRAARAEMLRHPQVKALVTAAASWPGPPLTRHNDASHPIYAFTTLADFGLRHDDSDMVEAVALIMDHQATEGAFQSLLNIPVRFGGSGEETWSWVLCDAPTLLYVLLAMGLGHDSAVQQAAAHLVGLANENGWRCRCAPELGAFRGPGRKDDPCPMANVYALKALSQVPELRETPAARAGIETLLWHWAHQSERKMYLFGIGTDFRKIKYPFVWYDNLHVLDVLSRFPCVHPDPRYQEMVRVLENQADDDGRYTAGSMYRAWQGWSFADKKRPSPWLTFLVLRVLKRSLATAPVG
ncbi:MAG: hypothetical protein ACWGPS_03935 [Candidatus Promineifilaceae bacterium]